jgi:hypothetical protein
VVTAADRASREVGIRAVRFRLRAVALRRDKSANILRRAHGGRLQTVSARAYPACFNAIAQMVSSIQNALRDRR